MLVFIDNPTEGETVEFSETAIEHYEKALEIAREVNIDPILKEKALVVLGMAWFNLGNSQKAAESIRSAREFAKKGTDKGIFLAMNNCLKF